LAGLAGNKFLIKNLF